MFLLWLRVAAVLYAVASISALPAVLYDKPGWKKLCVPAAVGGFFFHFVSLIEMLAASHHSLPVGMHEVQSLLALLICAAFLLVAVLYRTVSFGMVCGRANLAPPPRNASRAVGETQGKRFGG